MPDGDAGLVSVVIPTRNRAALVREAVASALAQNWAPIEVIVVDDASTDDTPAVLQAMAVTDGRIRVFSNHTPVGGSAARNQGIDAARGRYVAFLDDDDLWVPEKLRVQIERLERSPGAAAVSCHFVVKFPSGRERYVAVPPAPDLQHILRVNHLGGASMCLTTKAMLDAVGGFDPDLPSCQDWDLWIKLRQAGEVPVCETPLVWYRPHTGGRITTQRRSGYVGRRRLLRRYRARMTPATRRHYIEEIVFLRSVLMERRPWSRVQGLWRLVRTAGGTAGPRYVYRYMKEWRAGRG